MSLISFAESILGQAGLTQLVIPIVEQELLKTVESAGVPAVERLLTIPSSTLQAVCAKTGADFATAEAKQQAAVDSYAEFLEYVATKVDPALTAA